MDLVEAKVVKAFSDADDLSRAYAPGDIFSGSAQRVESLAGRGYLEAPPPPGPSPSGWEESDGPICDGR